MELKELTEKFKAIFGELEDFNLELLTESNCSKYLELINNDFSDEFEKAIEAKKVAEQNARAQEVKNQQNLKNAENNLRVKELEAKANSVLTESLTDNVLRKMYIEKWDGKLPQYQGNGTPIIDLK